MTEIIFTDITIQSHHSKKLLILCHDHLQRIVPVIRLINLLIIFRLYTHFIRNNIRFPIHNILSTVHDSPAVINPVVNFAQILLTMIRNRIRQFIFLIQRSQIKIRTVKVHQHLHLLQKLLSHLVKISRCINLINNRI